MKTSSLAASALTDSRPRLGGQSSSTKSAGSSPVSLSDASRHAASASRSSVSRPNWFDSSSSAPDRSRSVGRHWSPGVSVATTQSANDTSPSSMR